MAALLLAAACPTLAAATKAAYSVAAVRPGDEAGLVVRDGGKTLRVDLRSSIGIGRVSLKRTKEAADWPERIELWITMKAGRPLKKLEGVEIVGDRFRIEGARRFSVRMRRYELKPGERTTRGKKHREVNVRVEKTPEAMKVIIPGQLLSGEPVVRIQWVAYYRG